MATITKITEKPTASQVMSGASVLITQQETVDGKQIEAVRRAPIWAFAEKIASLLRLDLKAIEAVEGGIRVVHMDDTEELIEIHADGLAFDAVTYDQETGYLHITLNGEDVVDPAFIGGGPGGGTGFGSEITITNRLPSRAFSVSDSAASCQILCAAVSLDKESGDPTGSLTENWYVNNTRVRMATVAQGNLSFEAKPYLTAGATNTVKLVVEDSYGNSKPFTWTVTCVSYALTWNVEEFGFHGGNALNIRLIPSGQGEKTVKVAVDGTPIYTQTVASSGRAIAVTVPVQSHGAHAITAWMETTVDGQAITTTPLRHVGIWTESGVTTTIVAVYESTMEATRYETVSIKYRIYNPASETATAQLGATGETATTVTVGRDTQTWTYRLTTAGSKTLSVSSGGSSASITLTVADLDYDITPVTRGLAMKLDPTGHTNAEANRTQFGYVDGEGTNHPLTFSQNFDWTDGGFQIDEEGVTALVVKKGTSVTFDRSVFADNAKTSGKELKIVFKVTECRNYDAEILSCKADNIGLKLYAQQGTLSSALQSATVRYCEEKKIEMDVNIEATTEDRLAVVWLEGVPARAIAYESSDNWQQASPQLLTIGSADADVWIYGIKLYATSLTRSEILDNFIADCGSPEEMVDRYRRNDIFNETGTINETKLAQAKPELRVIHIWANKMTTAKDDEVLCKVTLVWTNGGAEYEFTAENVTMKAQGTSSLEYILAALNLDLDFSTATLWENGNGEGITAYAMRPGAIPVNYINLKVNVASSENANNVCMADDYNAFQPYIKPARAANPAVRDCIEGHPAAIFFTSTAEEPITVGARTLQPGETILYAAGDICNSKKNNAVFGQDLTAYPQQFCVEIHNNNSLQCRFKSADLTGETWDGKGNASFDVRFPKKPTDANKATWAAFLAWVVSTDRSAAPDTTLPGGSVTYNGVEYATDSEAYRAAKFKAEFGDHAAVPSFLYHYLVTERRLLPDNRAKNTFFEYDYDEDAGKWLWNIVHGYDFDTMSGNDNSGGLTFDYGLEDTDMVGAAYVFNASDSVLWCNIRDLFADELDAMFRTLEAAGAWSSSRIIAKWKAYRDTRPEGLLIEDMWNKYFAPYIYAQEERYIRAMLGTKEDQLQQFETYQEPYQSAKHGGSVSTADRISLRANAPEEWGGVEPSGNITGIVPYASTYITVKYGNAGTVKVRAVRGQSYDIEMPEGASLNDLETYIYSASNIASIGSLAGLYTKFADLSSAKKLQQMILGSDAEGYANTSLNSENGGVSFGNNILMRKIDLRGNPNLAQGLNLSVLKSLEEIYTTGSGVTGITFARRAPVRIAQLNAIRQLIARDLTSLETFAMPATNLQTVWIENCPLIDTKALVTAATNLTRGRIIGINWELDNTALLKRLANLAGMDNTGENADRFVLTGSAHISMISADDLATLGEAFPELTITYDTEIPSFTVVFKAADGTTTLNTQRIAQGSAPEDPTQFAVNPIATPTKASTIAQTFTFDGWSWQQDGTLIEDLSQVAITGNTTLYAHFAAATRTYTVRWYNGRDLLETQVVNYGQAVTFSGSRPTNASEGDYAIYYVFKGWDKSTGFICEDLDVHAVYAQATAPTGKTFAQLSAAELHALIATGVLSPTGTNNDVIASGDTTDIIAGHDFNFENVEGHELISVDDPKTFDGSTEYFKPQIGGQDILLFNTDKSFTLAIDFAFATDCTAGGCLASSYQSNGFLLRMASGGSLRFGSASAKQVSSNGVRQMVVIRKQKGDATLHVYSSNKNGSAVSYSGLTQASDPTHTAPLCFGAQLANDGYTESYGKGSIYWAKLWDDDLGDAVCRELASWPRETWTMQAVGTSERAFRSFVRVDNDHYPDLTLLLKNLLEETHQMNSTNTNVGGWKAAPMRTWLNNRIFAALPVEWQELVVTVKVHSSAGNKSSALVNPPAEDKIWIPSMKEMNQSVSTSPYSLEAEAPFTVFTNDASRIKKLNGGAGAASAWWLRSPFTGITTAFYGITASGSNDSTSYALYSYGVAFGFCI